MNRRRSKSRAGLPRNLYERKGYYSWRNPLTGDEFGVGTDRASAIEEALEANLRIAKQTLRPRLVDRIGGERTLLAWETKYQQIVKERGLTKETRASYLSFSRRVLKILGDKPMRSITPMAVSQGLDQIAKIEGKPRTAQAVQAYMRYSFEAAIAAGWIDTNPVRKNVIIGGNTAKRARLSLEVFMRVYESAPTVWLKNAMALALVSAQRREDVARAEFKDFREGGWWLTQASEKTDHPHRIFIPGELKPNGFPESLGEVATACRRTGVVSRYLVHQTQRRGKSSVGGPIRLSTVSRCFTESVEALGLDWGDKTPPTFHEIRSLSLRLYGAQGVNVQLLAGHSDPSTTAIYLNSRGHDWARVTV